MKPSRLTARQGKTLRYVVARDRNAKETVYPEQCVIRINWSDLPHSLMQAKYTLSQLEGFGLVLRRGRGYVPTKEGVKLIKAADEKGRWMTPPPPEIINQRRRK